MATRTLPPRDKRGRFCKQPPLDPALVASLGQGRRALYYTLEQSWRLEIQQITRYPVRPKAADV